MQVATAWLHEQCAIVNGVMFPDDRVYLVSVTSRPRQSPLVACSEETVSISSVFGDADVEFTELTGLFEAEYPDRGLVVACGEGGMGGDGFVAVLKSGNRELVWLAFFDASNPFIRASLAGDIVHAVSSLGHCWRFPVDRPERVSAVEECDVCQM